jgi:CRP-like cAMP-binding protein
MRARQTKTDPQVDRLRSLVPMARCSPAELSQAARLGTFVTVPAGRVLCREGELGREVFVVAHGEVEVAKHGQVIARLGPGSLCGEIAVVIGGSRRATARTATPVTVYAMSAAEFRGLLAQAPTVAAVVQAQLAARLDEA